MASRRAGTSARRTAQRTGRNDSSGLRCGAVLRAGFERRGVTQAAAADRTAPPGPPPSRWPYRAGPGEADESRAPARAVAHPQRAPLRKTVVAQAERVPVRDPAFTVEGVVAADDGGADRAACAVHHGRGEPRLAPRARVHHVVDPACDPLHRNRAFHRAAQYPIPVDGCTIAQWASSSSCSASGSRPLAPGAIVNPVSSTVRAIGSVRRFSTISAAREPGGGDTGAAADSSVPRPVDNSPRRAPGGRHRHHDGRERRRRESDQPSAAEWARGGRPRWLRSASRRPRQQGQQGPAPGKRRRTWPLESLRAAQGRWETGRRDAWPCSGARCRRSSAGCRRATGPPTGPARDVASDDLLGVGALERRRAGQELKSTVPTP